ncbi:Glutaredoxin-related protein 5, mitochondrial [Oopsacas minuta]|uniref:Glutaredoxin-related protein 5, mitochondrial n=1 Tax=Oopsacas minuta TaxID=111878 RepID=A0AAV7KJX7_9METZ|nr:Glutaredoxin-related protein 5, mitochondrial [Oopsacas minuta]
MAYKKVLNLRKLITISTLHPVITTRYISTSLYYSIPYTLPMAIPQRRLYSDTTEEDSEVNTQIRTLINSDKVVVFMKGTPERPMCGFSKAVVQILQIHGVQFSSINVLEDNSLRQGVKEYTSWPTIPQIFFNGELLGGMDILFKMHQEDELVTELEKIGIKSRLANDTK